MIEDRDGWFPNNGHSWHLDHGFTHYSQLQNQRSCNCTRLETSSGVLMDPKANNIFGRYPWSLPRKFLVLWRQFYNTSTCQQLYKKIQGEFKSLQSPLVHVKSLSHALKKSKWWESPPTPHRLSHGDMLTFNATR